jgi:N-acetylglucosaminyl-diphospho-decaprenol L-rhamnosyltransferase
MTELRSNPRGVASPATSECGFSAVVVSYRSGERLLRSLPPLLEAGAETLVVDNDSGDASASLVKDRFGSVTLIENSTNEGFAAANNRALKHLSGEVVLLVNPDCEVAPGAAHELVSYLREHPDVGIVAPRIEDVHGQLVPSAHRFESAASVLFLLIGGRTLLAPATKRLLARLLPAGSAGRRSFEANFETVTSQTVDWVSGACLAVRVGLLRSLGGLDEGYFLYMEDEDLCRRVWQHGWKVVYLPTARARHEGGASSGDPTLVWPAFYQSLLRFQALTQPRTYPLVRCAVLLRALAGIALGAARDGVYVVRRRPRQHRAVAWARIVAIAACASRARALRPWRSTADEAGLA